MTIDRQGTDAERAFVHELMELMRKHNVRFCTTMKYKDDLCYAFKQDRGYRLDGLGVEISMDCCELLGIIEGMKNDYPFQVWPK